MTLTRFLRRGIATNEGIAGVSFGTHARRRVIYRRALRQEAARSRARISAFLSDAGFVGGTIRIYRALRSAIRGHTNIILHATARRCVANGSTQGVRSTR